LGIVPKKILRRPPPSTQKSASIGGARRDSLPAATTGPLKVRDVAALCGVEQKTVHNWVSRGMLPHFRTPGRHLRFLSQEVAEFVARGRSEGVGEPTAATAGGGTANVVVVVVPGAEGERRIRGELLSLRRALPGSRIVWLGEAPSRALPADVEYAATAAGLRGLLRRGANATQPPASRETPAVARPRAARRRRSLRPRDRHRSDTERR
jgi:excisionase family DNA binding protein